MTRARVEDNGVVPETLGHGHAGGNWGDIEVPFAPGGSLSRPEIEVSEEVHGVRFRRGSSVKRVSTSFRLGRSSASQSLAPHKFHAHLASGKTFNNVLEGAELENLRDHAELMSSEEGHDLPFLLRLKSSTFAVALGLSSQGQMWGGLSRSKLMTAALGGFKFPEPIQVVIWTLAVLLLTATAVCYIAKAVLYPGAVKREWAHPIRSSFVFAAVLASMTLMIGVPPVVRDTIHPKTDVHVSAFLFFTVLLMGLELSVYGKWLFNTANSLRHANPTYQLAVVGNFLAAILGTRVSGSEIMMIVCAEIALFFFAVGILYQLLVFFAIQHNSASTIQLPMPMPMPMPKAVQVPPVANAAQSQSQISRVTQKKELELSIPALASTAAVGSHSADAATPPPAPAARFRQPACKTGRGVIGFGRLCRVASPSVRSASTRSSTDGIGKVQERLEPRRRYGAPPTDEESGTEVQLRESGASDYNGSVGGGAQYPEAPGMAEIRLGQHALISSNGSSFNHAITRGQTAADIDDRGKPEGEISKEAIAREAEESSPGEIAKEIVHQEPVAYITSSLHPIYFLFVAPPSAAAAAWSGISETFDKLSKSLYFIAAFMYLFLAIAHYKFLNVSSFSISWWAYSFPSSTFAFATLMYAEALESEPVAFVALGFSAISTVVVLLVFALTIRSALKGELFGRDPVVCVRLDGNGCNGKDFK